MSEIKMTVRGWPALCVGVVILGFLGFRLVAARQALDEKRLQMIKDHLLGEYSGQPIAKVRAAIRAGDREEAEELGEALLKLENITFASISARGAPSDMVVRLEVRVDGGPPPDGKSVRYYRMRHSLVTGLSLPLETTGLRYWLSGLFF